MPEVLNAFPSIVLILTEGIFPKFLELSCANTWQIRFAMRKEKIMCFIFYKFRNPTLADKFGAKSKKSDENYT
jgi:hypothetical protein